MANVKKIEAVENPANPPKPTKAKSKQAETDRPKRAYNKKLVPLVHRVTVKDPVYYTPYTAKGAQLGSILLAEDGIRVHKKSAKHRSTKLITYDKLSNLLDFLEAQGWL